MNITWKGGKVKKLKSTEEAKKLLTSEGPCMVIIYADWCGHCQAAEPEWNKLSKLVDGKADVYAIESADYTAGDVSSYPTMKIVKNGQSKDYEGDRSAENMKDALLGRLGGKRTRGRRSRRLRRRTRKAH